MKRTSSRCSLLATTFSTLLASLLLVVSSADAQTLPPPLLQGNGYDLRLFRPAVDSKGQFTVNGTDILGAGDVSFGFVGDAAFGLLHAGHNGAALVSNTFGGVLAANIGIANLLVVGLQVPIVGISGPGSNDMAVQGLPAGQYVPPTAGLNYQGLGDVTVHAKLRWLRAEYYPIGLAIIVQAGYNFQSLWTNWGAQTVGSGMMTQMVPADGGYSGNYAQRSFAGEPGGFVWPSVAVEWRPTRRIRVDANAGFRLPFAAAFSGGSTIGPNNQSGGVTYGPMLTWGLGASARVAPVLDLVLETYGGYIIGGGSVPESIPMEIVGGLKIFVQRNSYLMLGGGTGRMWNGYAAADARAFVGIVFEPSIGDADGDGYRDDVDQCPNDPEDFDGFQDEDGCSDPDNDRDGIPDVEDQCPNIPEDRDGVQDNDGCPEGQESDRDGDGILDNADRCPDDPEDRDGFQDQDGCPDPDNDNDSIPDTLDNCPNDPEDLDGFQDDDGCPDPDNDEDRIPDVNDRCPNQPEVYNGVEDEDGCPDSGDLQILGNVITLRQQIQFETDSAEIRPVSFPIIEQMAELMRHNPQFQLVEVEGHTDERASDEHNLQLSHDRANSVMQALVQRGIDPHRLVAAGYGELCPLDPRHNPHAWERNRRVQFIIVRTRDEGRTTAAAGCRRGAQYIPPEVGPPGTGVAREATGSTAASSAPPASGAPASSAPPAQH